MICSDNLYIGRGVYSVQEAARLTGADYGTIRRWLLGYSYKAKDGNVKERPPIFRAEFGDVDGQFIISFQDLIELLFVASFRKRGVKWTIIHEAFELAKERFNSNHPFSVINFKTDGKRIYEETIQKRRSVLSDLHFKQLVMAPVIESTLVRALEFKGGTATQWFPTHPSKTIVLDPNRSFGRPIIDRTGVPTEVLFAAYQAEDNFEYVAREFDTPVADVRKAVQFQIALAA